MNNEPNKPIEAEELTEKELEGVVGGGLSRAVPNTIMKVLVREGYSVLLAKERMDDDVEAAR